MIDRRVRLEQLIGREGFQSVEKGNLAQDLLPPALGPCMTSNPLSWSPQDMVSDLAACWRPEQPVDCFPAAIGAGYQQVSNSIRFRFRTQLWCLSQPQRSH
jgi:hypothetical protein